ncbi:MAG: bacillithiol biosynthesis BshC, partial [Candidatus Heimdallarchaeota archaeon]|nr:bacillithiol biosynthesis BshC [Candidatus Heimdallarchaeota archaeon]
MSELQNLNVLFESLSQKSRPADSFWGPIPKTYNQAILSVKNDMSEVTADPSEDQKLTELQKFLRVFHKSMGIYSKKLEENIKLLSKGSIITGQQPIVFGGPGLIGNKIACVLFLIELAETKGLGLAPIFFVGDYDGLQKELTRVYMPNPISHSPFIIDSGDEIPEDSNIAAHKAKLPSYEWLKDHLNKIEDNLKGFAKKVNGPAKTLFRERWYHAVTLLKTSFLKATTLSEWSTILWGTICNIILDEGLIFVPTSHPVVRRLVVDEYHPFIQQRKRYSKAFNQTTKAIVAKGYNPTLPPRHTNNSPFTIECVDDGNRLTTTIETRNDQIFAEGVCPECKKSRSYDISSLKKLQKIAEIIGPRVDSSQAIFQQLLRIKIRVSGPGEIAYFTQVVSALLA